MVSPANVRVEGNLEGNIVIGDNNFVVHTNHGTIVYKQAAPQVRLRQFTPRPPRPPRGFVNRAIELAKLEEWIASNEVVLIHAPDGVGKTALLRQAANGEASRAMPNGVVLLEPPLFEGQSLGADDVFQQLFEALFESDPPLKVDSVTARTYLSNTRPLVILDEVPLPPMLQRALPDLIPQGAFLLSADLPTGGDFQRLSVGPLPRDEAVGLLAEKAGIEPDETLRFICGLLEDISLAVIITGNLMRETGMTPTETLTALGAIQVGGMDPVAIALDRAYMLAFSKLGQAERKILSAAAFTPGVSMSPEWFNLVLGANVETALERLKTLGLLYANSPRLRLPTGFRLTARRRALLSENDIFPKLVAYLLAGATRGQEFITNEIGNFLGALDWAVRAGRSGDVIALGRMIDSFLCLRGLWDTWGRVLDLVLQAALRVGDRATEAWALHQLGTRLIGLDNPAQATELLTRALKLRQKLGDSDGVAYTLHNLEILSPLVGPAIPSTSFLRLAIGVVLGLMGLALAAIFLAWLAVARPFSPPVPTSTPTVTPTFTSTTTLTPTSTVTPTPSPTPDTNAPQARGILVEPAQSYYGDGAVACKLPHRVILSLEASDPAGVASVEARYRYRSGNLQGEWRQVAMTNRGDDLFRLEINHNETESALRVLDGLDGELEWEATVTDAFGNFVTVPGPSAVVTYSRCEAAPPRILRPFTKPASSNYGDVALCGGAYPTQMEIYAYVQDDSALKEVSIQYYYRGNSNGPLYTLPLAAWGQNLYGNFLDNNANNLAMETLKEEDGFFIWRVIAVDEFGNRAESQEFSVPVEYHYCPPPG